MGRPRTVSVADPRGSHWVRLCLVGLVGGGGCTSVGHHLSARPTPSAQWEWGIVTSTLVLDRGLGTEAFPNPEFTWRYGLGHRVDIGGRINALGAIFDPRIGLWSHGLSYLALVPETGFALNALTNDDVGPLAAVFGVGLLMDIPLARQVTAVTGLRLRGQLEFGPTAFAGRWQGKWMSMPGGSVGVKWQLTPAVHLFPEITMFARHDSLADAWRPPTAQIGLSIGITPGAQ